jgi:glycerophosphoryl diester phosphodiesterase
MIRFLLALLLALAAGCATRLDVQGHRGARGLLPENTLPAFERAIDLGVTTVELDVAVTRDGVVVISHDAALNPDITRGPDGSFLAARGPAIHSLAYEELLQYDVGRLNPGSAYGKPFTEQRAIDGTRIPRLAELFELARRKGADRLRFNIEIKSDPTRPELSLAPEPFARAVIDEVRRARVQRRVTIQSFDWRPLAVVQREAPEIETAYLTVQARGFDTICAGASAGDANARAADCAPTPWTAGFRLADHGSVPRMVRAAGGRIWSPRYQDVDEAILRDAHAAGVRVVVWTVNEPEVIAKMLELGVDGIISDRPDIVMRLARDRASR